MLKAISHSASFYNLFSKENSFNVLFTWAFSSSSFFEEQLIFNRIEEPDLHSVVFQEKKSTLKFSICKQLTICVI